MVPFVFSILGLPAVGESRRPCVDSAESARIFGKQEWHRSVGRSVGREIPTDSVVCGGVSGLLVVCTLFYRPLALKDFIMSVQYLRLVPLFVRHAEPRPRRLLAKGLEKEGTARLCVWRKEHATKGA